MPSSGSPAPSPPRPRAPASPSTLSARAISPPTWSGTARAVPDHVGGGIARADSVDGDAGARGLGGEGAGEPEEGMLGGGVRGDVRRAAQRRHGGDVDDAAPAPPEHVGQERPAQ